jgi:hypothetical protein
MSDEIARGEAIIRSGKHAPPRGEYLGRIEYWGQRVTVPGQPCIWHRT